MSKNKKLNLDADSGQIVSDEFAEANPKSVVAVKRMHKMTKIFDEARLGNKIFDRVSKLKDSEINEFREIVGKINNCLE